MYAAKIFLPDHAKAFANEKKAYEQLEESGRYEDSLLRYYGSYTHQGVNTLILSYANGGTWQRCLQEPRPQRVQDVVAVWQGLLSLVKAVDRIHVVKG